MKNSEVEEQSAGIFLRAAAYIRRYGWQKSGMGRHGQPRCSMGALASAYPEDKWDKSLAGVMYEALYRQLDGMSLTQFNYRFNDGDKVASLYEKVAKSLVKTKTVST